MFVHLTHCVKTCSYTVVPVLFNFIKDEIAVFWRVLYLGCSRSIRGDFFRILCWFRKLFKPQSLSKYCSCLLPTQHAFLNGHNNTGHIYWIHPKKWFLAKLAWHLHVTRCNFLLALKSYKSWSIFQLTKVKLCTELHHESDGRPAVWSGSGLSKAGIALCWRSVIFESTAPLFYWWRILRKSAVFF